jgi:hypothetical protein
MTPLQEDAAVVTQNKLRLPIVDCRLLPRFVRCVRWRGKMPSDGTKVAWRRRQQEKGRTSIRKHLHVGGIVRSAQFGNSLSLSGKLRTDQDERNGRGIALYSSEPCALTRPPPAPEPAVTNSGRINRSSSKLYFAVANGCCFYTLRATGPYPVETQACFGHQPYVVLVGLLLAFLRTTRFWRSAQTCNRIHRIGG